MINRLLLLVLVLLLYAVPAWAEKIGGYIPSTPRAIEIMLDLANVKPADTVYDLGSGDGRVLIAAARRGAFAVGLEIDSQLVRLSRLNIEQVKLGTRIKVLELDIFSASFSPATVITLFFGPIDAPKLERKLRSELRPGTRIVSNSSPIGNWKPLKIVDIGQRQCDIERLGQLDVCQPAPLYLYKSERNL